VIIPRVGACSGANIFGGSARLVTRQPISVEGSVVIDITAGRIRPHASDPISQTVKSPSGHFIRRRPRVQDRRPLLQARNSWLPSKASNMLTSVRKVEIIPGTILVAVVWYHQPSMRGDPLARSPFGSKSAEIAHGAIWLDYLHSPHTALSQWF
jgi:hypothetical protein